MRIWHRTPYAWRQQGSPVEPQSISVRSSGLHINQDSCIRRSVALHWKIPSSRLSDSIPDETMALPLVQDAIRRGIIAVNQRRVKYALSREKSYNWDAPEEWMRAVSIAWLIVEKDYPANRVKLEVAVPRQTPTDFADIVVHEDDFCRVPYLVVGNKACGQNDRDREQGIEQAFGNANSLRAPLTLYDEAERSALFDIANHPPTERTENLLGGP